MHIIRKGSLLLGGGGGSRDGTLQAAARFSKLVKIKL